MNMVRKIIGKFNSLLKRSYWYNEKLLPDCKKFIYHNRYNLDIVNLGSSSAKYAFDYSGLEVAASNWAMEPQSFVNDYAVLTNYSSFLKKGAKVIIPICPFSSLGGGNDYFADKYYTFIRPISIPNYSLKKRNDVKHIQNYPIFYYPFYGMLYDVYRLFARNEKQQSYQHIKQDAKRRIDNWKREFSIYKFEDDLSLINQDRYDDSLEALKQLINYCMEHGYQPILVLPPVSPCLSEYFTDEVREKYIYSFIEKCNIDGVPFIDYIDDTQFKDQDLYMTSFTLNKKGRKVFTARLLKDIAVL